MLKAGVWRDVIIEPNIKKIKEIKHIDFNTRPNIQNDMKEKKKDK